MGRTAWSILQAWLPEYEAFKKMILFYIIFAGMSCGISMVGLQASFNIYDRRLYEKSLQELEFFTQNVDDDLLAIENMSYTFAMNMQVQEARMICLAIIAVLYFDFYFSAHAPFEGWSAIRMRRWKWCLRRSLDAAGIW